MGSVIGDMARLLEDFVWKVNSSNFFGRLKMGLVADALHVKKALAALGAPEIFTAVQLMVVAVDMGMGRGRWRGATVFILISFFDGKQI